jgi:hypothetical protein
LSMAIDDAIPLENHQWKHRWGSKFTLSYNMCLSFPQNLTGAY